MAQSCRSVGASVREDRGVAEAVISVGVGLVAVAFAIWRWRTPPEPGTGAAWRLFGARYDERPESGFGYLDRKIRQSALVALCGSLLIVGGISKIVSEL